MVSSGRLEDDVIPDTKYRGENPVDIFIEWEMNHVYKFSVRREQELEQISVPESLSSFPCM